MSNETRFYFDNQPDCPVKAAGLLLRRWRNGQAEYMIQERRYLNDGYTKPSWIPKQVWHHLSHFTLFEDFGGKVESCDTSIFDIMVRECQEESNGVLNPMTIRERLNSRHARFFYSRRSQYVLAILPATPDETHLSTDDFGACEEHLRYHIERRVKWMSAKELKKMGWFLHCRIQHVFQSI